MANATILNTGPGSDLDAFASELFGVNLRNDPLESKYERIHQLQKELSDLISSLQDKPQHEKFRITTEHLMGQMMIHPFIRGFHLNPNMFVSSEHSTVYYQAMPLRAYFSSMLDQAPYIATVFHTLPYFHFNLLLYKDTVAWTAHNALFLAPAKAQYDALNGLLKNPVLINGGCIDPYMADNTWHAKVPAMSMQCTAPYDRHQKDLENMQSHPHNSGTSSPFSDLCVGDNPFMTTWSRHRVREIGTFFDFIDGASFWVSHFNLSDSFGTRAVPPIMGVKEPVRPEVFDLALDIVHDLSMPLLWTFEKTLNQAERISDPAEAVNFCRLIPETALLEYRYGEQNLSLPDYLSAMTLKLENIGPVVQGLPRNLDNYLSNAEPADFGRKMRDYGDTCYFALHASAGYTNWELMLILREVAYAVVLLHIAQSAEMISTLRLGEDIRYGLQKPNFIDLLKFQILAGMYFTSFQNDRMMFIDKGYRNGRLMRERILSPYVFAEVVKNQDNSQSTGRAGNIIRRLSLRGFQKSDIK